MTTAFLSAGLRAANLPSSAALRVFLAVAQSGSTARAAMLVHLTQGAVSKQVRALETLLGVALFERHAGGLKLTEEGQIYRPYAEAALEQMARGAMRIAERQRLTSPIRLHMIAIVGERWLMGRFPRFAETHPTLDVQFTNYVSESTTEEPDLTILHGVGPWEGRECHYLFGREVALIASPALIARQGGFASPGDIQRMTLLQHFLMPSFWAEFTESAALRGAVPARTIRYGYFSVIIQAAVAGLGVALVPACFVREELGDGRLVNPLGLSFNSASGCWLTVTDARPEPEGLRALIDWMTAEAKDFDRLGRAGQAQGGPVRSQ
jgi:DNA-binding transcriptional LysR family regulator